MAQPTILESYLIKVGMQGPSANEQRDAEKAFDTLAQAVAVAVPVITAAASAVIYATGKIAEGLSKLFYESQKTHTTVERLKALGHAAEQSGSSVAQITFNLEILSGKLDKLGPGIKTLLKNNLGLTDKDFADPVEALRATLKALNTRYQAGGTSRVSEESLRKLLGLDLDAVLAAGRPEFDKAFDEQFKRGKGLNEAAEGSVKLVQALNRLGEALSTIGQKADAELFAKYGATLDSLSDWVNDN